MNDVARKRWEKYGMGNHGPTEEHFDPVAAFQMSQTTSAPYPQWERWARFLNKAASTREYFHLMSAEEQQALNDLPETVTVYRGIRTSNPQPDHKGLSWTLDRDVAIWFSENRGEPNGPSHVLTRTIPKAAIVWLLQERNESEIVVAPDYL